MSTRLRILRLVMSVTAAGAGALAMIVVLARCQVPGGPTEPTPSGSLMTDGVCIGACLPDPGWGPVDCSPEKQVDTWGLETFDVVQSNGQNIAQDWYTYTDGTAALNFMNFADAAVDGGYQPQVQYTALCSNDDPVQNRILHIFGGQFLGWGGGMGLAMAKVNGREPSSMSQGTPDPLAPRAVCNGQPDAAICPPANAEYAVKEGAIDVSQYEGVSFWARRGPNSQAGLHVLVGDKHTDDDLNYLAQRAPFDTEAGAFPQQTLYCQRVRECDCISHQACVTYPNGVPGSPALGILNSLPQYCTLPPPLTQQASECTGGVGAAGGVGPSNCCDRYQCDQWDSPFPNDGILPDIVPYNRSSLRNPGLVPGGGLRPAPGSPGGPGFLGDPQFAGRPCTPYQWQNGVGGSFCFDPAIDPPPAPNTELCGDHWMTTVTLGTEWQYFKVPFAVLHQQGWAKKSEQLDLTAVSVVRFTWDAGWLDYYIDSLSFYREKPPG